MTVSILWVEAEGTMPPCGSAVKPKTTTGRALCNGREAGRKDGVFPLRLQYATARGVASTATVQDEPRASASVRGALALVVG